MGMSKAIYLGPYIRAEQKITESERIDIVCPNGHKKGNDESFCPVCGEKTIEKRTPMTTSLSFYDMMNEELVPWKFEDVMMVRHDEYDNPNIDFLIPNLKGFGMYVDEVEGGEVQLDADVSNEKARLEDMYAEFIEAVNPHYESLEICYGIVVWYW